MFDGIKACIGFMFQDSIILFFSMICVEVLFTWINKMETLFNMLI
jgi:hypothetical protein